MSWYQLLDIYKQDQAWRQWYANQPPVACPNDGTPLEEGPGGELFCRHDGWQYPRDYVRPPA
jgi:hypothetical protein